MIDIDALIAAVRAVADDRVLENGCRYFDYLPESNDLNYDCPVCIIGHALVMVDAATLVDSLHNGTRVAAILPRPISQSRIQIEWLRTVQQEQDGHQSWKASVARADAMWPLS